MGSERSTGPARGVALVLRAGLYSSIRRAGPTGWEGRGGEGRGGECPAASRAAALEGEGAAGLRTGWPGAHRVRTGCAPGAHRVRTGCAREGEGGVEGDPQSTRPSNAATRKRSGETRVSNRTLKVQALPKGTLELQQSRLGGHLKLQTALKVQGPRD
jgi:hypothetical protein